MNKPMQRFLMLCLSGIALGVILANVHAGPTVQHGSRYYASASSSSSSSGGAFTPDSGWSTSGTMSDGQDVTITKGAGGLGFSTDPRPLFWIPAEINMARDATYSRDSTTITAQYNVTQDTSVKPQNATGAMRQNWPISANGTDPSVNTVCFFGNDPTFTFSTGEFFISLQRAYDFSVGQNSTHHNDKEFRVWSSPMTAGQDLYSLYEPASLGGAIVHEGYGNTDIMFSPSTNHFYTTNEASYRTFVQNEHIFKESTDNAFNGIMMTMRNTRTSHTLAVATAVRTRNSGGEPGNTLKTLGFLDQLSNPRSTDGSGSDYMDLGDKHIWATHIYVNDQIRRFVISSETSVVFTQMNGSNDPGIFREIQLPRNGTGSDTAVGLRIRSGTYTSLSGKCLWFWPNSGQAPERVGCWAFFDHAANDDVFEMRYAA